MKKVIKSITNVLVIICAAVIIGGILGILFVDYVADPGYRHFDNNYPKVNNFIASNAWWMTSLALIVFLIILLPKIKRRRSYPNEEDRTELKHSVPPRYTD